MHKPENEVQGVVRFVRYEWGMLKSAWDHLPEEVREGRWRTGTGHGYDDDAVIECFLLHARVLRDFYRQQRKALTGNAVTNIVAGDFFDRQEDWTPPALTYLAADVKTRLDRALTHLAYDRTDYLAEEKWHLKLAWDERTSCRRPASNSFENYRPTEGRGSFDLLTKR
jgi:hypothetical protein